MKEERWTLPDVLTPSTPHRYSFGWRWAPGPVAFCMGINPSFGTDFDPDATMQSLRRMLAHNGFGEYLLGNPFARRSLEPKALLALPILDAIGEHNDVALAGMIERADVLVACWGVPPPAPGILLRMQVVMRELERSGKPIKCFGRTKHGFPRHPLYMATKTALEDYRP